MANFQLAVFDMAGTTVRDKGNVADSFIQAFLDHDIQVEESAVKRVMGWRKMDAIHLLLDQFAPERLAGDANLAQQIHDRFTQRMVQFYQNDAELAPLPNTLAVFQALRDKGCRIALNSGFTREIVDTILQRLQWGEGSLVDATAASDEVPEGRPHPFMIRHLMALTGVSDPSLVVKIGDTEVDVEEGRNAECGMVVAVTTGAYTREQLELYHPDAIIDDLSELRSLIL
jgi:phosphonatase-like hydrolase